MKLKQRFRYSCDKDVCVKEDCDGDRDLSYNVLKYQQLRWTFLKYNNIDITESCLHWTLIFFNIYFNGDRFIDYTIDILNNKHMDLIVDIKDVHCSEMEPIILSLFSYYIQNNSIELSGQGDLCNSANNILVTYKWNDVYIDLVENKIVYAKRFLPAEGVKMIISSSNCCANVNVGILTKYVEFIQQNEVSLIKDLCTD